jgi:hypothetical protein
MMVAKIAGNVGVHDTQPAGGGKRCLNRGSGKANKKARAVGTCSGIGAPHSNVR